MPPEAPRTPLPSAPAPQVITPLAGERRIATVVLADVHRSTDLMEQLGTEAWVELMKQVLQLLATEVYRFGGRVDQFRGDGLVAFFGATDAHEDDPERAILAALAMQAAICPCASEMQHRDIDLKVRVGINTGEVIVGSVGEASRHREDTAMGGGVALAARMEAAAEPGSVLVAANTYGLTEARFEWQPLGEIAVKGISKPIAVYRPLRLRTISDSQQFPDIVLPLASSRSATYATLKGCVEALCSGRGGVVFVTGDKGMGKSLLMGRVQQHYAPLARLCTDESSDLARKASGFPPLTWLVGHCRSYDQSTPYALWIGLLRNWLEAPGAAVEPDLTALLGERTEDLWGDQAGRYRPYLATLLSLPVEDAVAERMAYLKAEGLQKQISGTIYDWVEALARRDPLVLVLNDLQFADSSSLDLLKQCLPICESAPVLWLANFRPDRSALVWQLRHHVETEYPHRLTSIDLPPLTADESRMLIDQTLGREALTEDTAALIIEKAEGNPYYLREIVLALIGQGLVRKDTNGIWRQVGPIRSFDLPGSLRGLLLARIDRLSLEERRVLQVAAVIGPLFWRNVLEGIVGDASHLTLWLTNLQRAQLIHEQGLLPDLGMEFTFSPSLVREVVYDGLLNAQRVAYHRQVAEQIEALFGTETPKPYHGLLTYHYQQAGDLNKELYHALGAAEEARKLYANADALGHYTSALTLLDRLEDQSADQEQLRPIRELRFEALAGRFQVQYPMGNIDAGDADARALLPLAKQMADDPAFMADALLAQPEVTHPETRAELTAALAMVQDALALSQQLNDKRREMMALFSIAMVYFQLKDPTWRELSDQALALTRQLGDLRMEVGLLLGIGDAYGMDDLQHSTEYLQAALTISQHLEDKETEMSLLAALSPQAERSGDYYRQLTEYERKRVQLSREIGNRLSEGHALMFCGQIEAIYLGDARSGLALMAEALRLWEETPDKLFPLLRIAQFQTALGQFKEAWSTLETARACSERVILDIGHAGLALVEAIFHNAQGGPEHWHKVLDLQAQVGQMVTENQLSRQYQMAAACEATAAHLGLAECIDDAIERAEHLQAALEAAGQALDIYRQFGFTQVVECLSEEIMYRRSLALAANGRAEEAREMLVAAHGEMMRKHNMIPEDSPFRRTFLEGIALHRQITAAHLESSR